MATTRRAPIRVPSDQQAFIAGHLVDVRGGIPLQRTSETALTVGIAFGDDTDGLYALLGLDPGAPISRVVAAYKRLATELHPDAGGDQEEFLRVKSAYETLSNPLTKAKYDQESKLARFLRRLLIRREEEAQEELRKAMEALDDLPPGFGMGAGGFGTGQNGSHHSFDVQMKGSFWTGGAQPRKSATKATPAEQVKAQNIMEEDLKVREMAFGRMPWSRPSVPKGVGFVYPWAYGIVGRDSHPWTLSSFETVALANLTVILLGSGLLEGPSFIVLKDEEDEFDRLVVSRWEGFTVAIFNLVNVFNSFDLREAADVVGLDTARPFFR